MMLFNISDAAALVSRMEAVARSMANSAERMEAVADRFEAATSNIQPPYKPLEISVTTHLDGKKIADAIRLYRENEGGEPL
jgi:hypothetical protein